MDQESKIRHNKVLDTLDVISEKSKAHFENTLEVLAAFETKIDKLFKCMNNQEMNSRQESHHPERFKFDLVDNEQELSKLEDSLKDTTYRKKFVSNYTMIIIFRDCSTISCSDHEPK